MRELLAHNNQIIPMMIVSGIGAELELREDRVASTGIMNPMQQWSDARNHFIPPRRMGENDVIRSNKAEKSPYIIRTLGHQQKVHTLDASYVFDQRNMPKLMEDAAITVGVENDRFIKYAICPHYECGAIYEQTGHGVNKKNNQQTCTQYRNIHREQPIGVINQATNDLSDRENNHKLNEHHDADCCKPYARCGTKLLNKSNDPILLYPYLGVKDPLERMLKRKGFKEKCELWRERYDDQDRRKEHETMADIYDGDLWQDYQYVNCRTHQPWTEEDRHRQSVDERTPLLARNPDSDDANVVWALALNLDWYEPFKGTNYSMGAIYITVLNLPREERYLTHNMILVGVLPGPKQTSREQLQGALAPLMAELNILFKGVQAPLADQSLVMLRAFLMCVICDSPAARKMSGTMTHSANVGCPYCMCGGTGGGRGAHWSPDNCPKAKWNTHEYRRTDGKLRKAAIEWSMAMYNFSHKRAYAAGDESDGEDVELAAQYADENHEELGQREERLLRRLERRSASNGIRGRALHASIYGSRYCALMDLSYFDMRRGVPIDVMHNIYLGLSKEMMSLLSRPTLHTTKPILSQRHLELLQSFMQLCECPSDIGAIPGKLAAKMSKFKSAEWMNWMTVFCVPAMRYMYKNDRPATMTEEHLQMLSHMQRVSALLQSNVITRKQIVEVEQLLEAVIDSVQELFPNKRIESGADSSAAAPSLTSSSSRSKAAKHSANAAPSSSSSAQHSSASSRSPLSGKWLENVKPNLHYAQHLPEMLHDYGPPCGWWCNSYERFNGLLAGVPRTPTHLEICTMKRYLLMHDASESAQAAMNSQGDRVAESFTPCKEHYESIISMMSGSSTDPILNEETGEMTSIRTTAGGKKSLMYSFGVKDWCKQYNKFHQQRMCARPIDIGEYGQTGLILPIVPLALIDRIRHSFSDVDGSESFPGRLLDSVKSVSIDNIASINSISRKLITAELIMGSLRLHYKQAYDGEIRAEGHKRGAPIGDDEYNRMNHVQQVDHLDNVYDFFIDQPLIHIYAGFEMAGETYGSVISKRNSKCSYVAINFLVGDNKKMVRGKMITYNTVVKYYARILFIMQHMYRNKMHTFAALAYYEEVAPRQPFINSTCVSDTTRFPVVNKKTLPFKDGILVPVQRILHRWIPAAVTPSELQVCPMTMKVHA